MMTENDIKIFLGQKNYDLRLSHNGRWIDQKCTPDVLWSVSDFIINYVENGGTTFDAKDIWTSDYAKETIRETFSKPETDDASAHNEYDKVFSQPLCLLCYAGIIKDTSTTTRHRYRVEKPDILEYIARNDIYALRFLQAYIEKVLKDSDLYSVFETFFNTQTKSDFQAMKNAFVDFYHNYTAVKGQYEPKRIFSKVLNPLAFKNGKCGTEKGRMSNDVINRSDMMYNRDNFRDVFRDKPKGVTRKDWLAAHPEFDVREGYYEQMMSAAKRLVRRTNNEYRNGISELTQFDETHTDLVPATQIHHIFPKNEFPDIKYYAENLIALTPNQHYGFAHPNNNTFVIDIAAQKVLLIAKTYSIKKNIEEEQEPIYEFENLLWVLAVGWNDAGVCDIERNDYVRVVQSINYHYA